MGTPKKIECFFCGRHGARAREHVFADAWLGEFQAGQERILLERRLFDADALQDTRTHTYDSFVCGDVCESCNAGWMSAMESTVKPWILGIQSKADISTLQDPLRRLTFSRWALKTACVIDHLGNREIPPRISHQLAHDRDAIPEHINVLAGWHPCEDRSLFSVNERNTWSQYPRETSETEAPTLPTEGWFKIAFSIGRLMVLVAGVPSKDFQLVIGTGIHVPIWPSIKIELHHWFYSKRLEGLAPAEALRNFSDLLAVSRGGRMWN